MHGLSEFYRLPDVFMFWVRSGSTNVDMWAVGKAIHETNHEIDFSLLSPCSADVSGRGYTKYFVNSIIHTTDLKYEQTDNFSIIQETFPAILRESRTFRYNLYLSTALANPVANDFRILLAELSAYSAGAQFEVSLLANKTYANMYLAGDNNAGGMVDFMAFLQYYLKSARLNHNSTYALLKSQPNTLAFIQFSWARAETILAAMYPYSVANSGNQTIPLDVLKDIYSPSALAELDAIGITHKTAADWQTTYFRQ